jgi:hypothetical protein
MQSVGKTASKKAVHKSARGNASQFFIAGELCRRGHPAVVTLGNTPNTDILCSNLSGTRFVHIQVKTFIPGERTCSVGLKAEKPFGENFFWVLGGIPKPEIECPFEYYVIPARVMAENVRKQHQQWLAAAGARGQAHNDSNVRTVHLPPFKSASSWSIAEFRGRWDLIEDKLRD